jgi:hypothetical protein
MNDTSNTKSDREHCHSTSSSPPPQQFLAVCLCIVDDLPHEEIWKYWMQDGAAELYLHAKYPQKVKSDWVK